jgi:hypothetical protein
VKVLGEGEELNQSLEKAGRVADFFELAELMCLDALERNESCGGHFREEYQTPDGEAQRDDEHFSYVAAWEFRARIRQPPELTRSRWSSNTCIPARGATSNENHPPHLAAAQRAKKGQRMARATKWTNVNPRHVDAGVLDVLNEDLIAEGAKSRWRSSTIAARASAASCGFMINGVAHGPLPGTTVCQLHMRHFKDGDELYLEPWRARAFPVVKDLVVDRARSTASWRPAATFR